MAKQTTYSLTDALTKAIDDYHRDHVHLTVGEIFEAMDDIRSLLLRFTRAGLQDSPAEIKRANWAAFNRRKI